MNLFQNPDIQEKYIPFTTTRLILENFADFSLITLQNLIKGGDLYKLYIKNASTPIRILYDTTKLSKTQTDTLADFNILLSRLIPGDTLVAQMIGPKGYSIHSTFGTDGNWTCRFFHHPEYYHHSSIKPNPFVVSDSLEIDPSSIESVKGCITTDNKNQMYRQSLEVKLSTDAIIIVILDKKLSQESYEIYLDAYGRDIVEGHNVWLPFHLNVDWTIGWKFLKWLDMAISWKKYYEGGLQLF